MQSALHRTRTHGVHSARARAASAETLAKRKACVGKSAESASSLQRRKQNKHLESELIAPIPLQGRTWQTRQDMSRFAIQYANTKERKRYVSNRSCNVRFFPFIPIPFSQLYDSKPFFLLACADVGPSLSGSVVSAPSPLRGTTRSRGVATKSEMAQVLQSSYTCTKPCTEI